jgi:hypothetical protein
MIVVLSNVDTPRLRYVLDFLLDGYSYSLQQDQADFPIGSLVIDYGMGMSNAQVKIPRMDFSWWHAGERDVISYRKAVELKADFGNFDLFGYAFYLLSRCDEHFPEYFDEWGRFQSAGCIQTQWGGVERAYLDEWRTHLISLLGLEDKRIAQHELTIDIDSPFAFKYKSFLFQMGGLVNDVLHGRLDWVKSRVQVMLGQPDPYDTYAALNAMSQEAQIELRYFVLCAERSAMDKGMSISQDEGWKYLTNRLAGQQWGWHPSFAGHTNMLKHRAELERLQQRSSAKIQSVRFHYLKESLFQMSPRLLSWGIEENYSMGFAETVGYRAGTSRPFHWYDWQNDAVSELKLVPFWGMDVTLKKYLRLTPPEALEKVAQASNYAMDIHGDWRMVWHNESVNDWSEWKGWGVVLKKFIQR